jgi:hypothetical protein
MTLPKRTFVSRERMGHLVLTGSILPLGLACGGRTSDTLSSEIAGASNSAVASGGASFGNGSGGAASTPASSTTGGYSNTTTGYGTMGCGTGTLAGYSSCSWDPPVDIATRCEKPKPASDFHGIKAWISRTCNALDYSLVIELKQDCYSSGVALDIPVLTSETSGVTIGAGHALEPQGIFEYPLHSTEPIEQRGWTNLHVGLAVTCNSGEPAVSVAGDCGWYK